VGRERVLVLYVKLGVALVQPELALGEVPPWTVEAVGIFYFARKVRHPGEDGVGVRVAGSATGGDVDRHQIVEI